MKHGKKNSTRAFYMLMGGVVGLPFVIAGDFPEAFVGIPYDETLDIVGSYTGPLTADTVEGLSAIPAGLTLEMNPAGTKIRLHGTPIGDFRLVGQLPPAAVGVPYSARLKVLRASGTVTPDIAAGSVPAWVSLTWHGGTQEIEFSGTPT